MQKMHNKH